MSPSPELSFSSVLVANRGEIARRIIRTLRDLGIRSIAVYSDADADAPHVREADAAVRIGPAPAAESYLDIDAVIAAARASGAEAVHPGYGFLSESVGLAEACAESGIVFIGPTVEALQIMGDKARAREHVSRSGVPVVPGFDARGLSDAEIREEAEAVGFPLLVKPSAGGGGKGMEVVADSTGLASALSSARRVAASAFGDDALILERLIRRPRHIEVQVFGDAHGTVVALGERECTLQRRHQKVIEEAPSARIPSATRDRLLAAAVRAAESVAYVGAGTVEFLVDADAPEDVFFIEMNTRLQVEHPVTEEVTGTDLVREQFRIAFGEGPSFTETPAPTGHAFEFRINAEDPGRGFLPSPGRVDGLRIPGGPGVRWDSGIEAGDTVQPAFDSMIAKLIVHADTRDAALVRARRALRELAVEGPATVIPFDLRAIDDPAFATATFAVHTQWIETVLLPALEAQPRPAVAPVSGLQRFPVEIDGRRVMLGLPAELLAGMGRPAGEVTAPVPSADPSELRAPAPGTLVRWLVDDGAVVAEGDPVAVLDAMKMETTVTAHRAGTLTPRADTGATLAADALLATIA